MSRSPARPRATASNARKPGRKMDPKLDRLRWGLALLCLSFLPALAGCRRGFFNAQGFVESRGGALGDWHSAPQACSRDPFDGKPVGQSGSIAAFIWEDPSVHDPLRDQHRPMAPDAPLRLELSRDGAGLRAGLTTVKTEGTLIVGADCTDFRFDSLEQAPLVAGAASALAGRLRMDCQVHGSHVRADLHFERCEF